MWGDWYHRPTHRALGLMRSPKDAPLAVKGMNVVSVGKCFLRYLHVPREDRGGGHTRVWAQNSARMHTPPQTPSPTEGVDR